MPNAPHPLSTALRAHFELRNAEHARARAMPALRLEAEAAIEKYHLTTILTPTGAP